MKNIINQFQLIILLFIIYFILERSLEVDEKYTLIEMRNFFNYNNIEYGKNINKHFVLFNVNYRKFINIYGSILFIEHNSKYDDILFLIPLYTVIVKTKTIVLCNESKSHINIYDIKIRKKKIYSIYSHCMIFDLSYFKLLHLHSDIFRFCNYNTVFSLIKNNLLTLNYRNICTSDNYTDNYSLVTTVYKRNNLIKQLYLFRKQFLPPKYIIVIHDRDLINTTYDKFNIIYIHTINFPAGFYFRYLMALLSPENDVIVYDDDWFPYNKSSHLNWIKRIKTIKNGYISHHTGSSNGMKWCATPLIVHRKWLYLMWYNEIYDKNAAEDGHLSFSLFLLCNIKCIRIIIDDLKYKYDKLSSSKHYITIKLWKDYTLYARNKINSSYINTIKSTFHIF